MKAVKKNVHMIKGVFVFVFFLSNLLNDGQSFDGPSMMAMHGQFVSEKRLEEKHQ